MDNDGGNAAATHWDQQIITLSHGVAGHFMEDLWELGKAVDRV